MTRPQLEQALAVAKITHRSYTARTNDPRYGRQERNEEEAERWYQETLRLRDLLAVAEEVA